MFQHGLLFLSYKPAQIASVLSNVGAFLKLAKSRVNKTLYVAVQSEQRLLSNSTGTDVLSTRELLSIIPRIYVEAHKFAPLLDVRVLHSQQSKRSLRFEPEMLFSSSSISPDVLKQYYFNNFQTLKLDIPVVQHEAQEHSQPETLPESHISDRVFENLCLGGTFDNIHNGHKIMLSTSLLKCSKRMTIGVTDRSMVGNKKLWELIEAPETRIQKLGDFLRDVKPELDYNIVPISDPFGPAIVDGELQAIVVSEETRRGGEKINEIRATKNMSSLQVETIAMLGDNHRESNEEEEKVSSSSLRMRKLGTLLREPQTKPELPTKPYIIGLTGMIASGKSSIAKKFEQLGAGIVNVDLIAHNVYSNKEKPAYKEIVQTFGSGILDADGAIDRKKLGEIVFTDPEKLQTLNGIVWPHVAEDMKKAVEELSPKHDVIVLEVALLIEAGFYEQMHQVWLTILDKAEVVKRLKDRNNLDEAEARKRISSMMPVTDKIPHADIIFCTNWDESVTWQQINRAWKIITDRFVEKKE